MTTVTISQLPEATTTSSADVYPLVQNAITKKITFTNLFGSATGIPIVNGTTGILSVDRGGTGATTATGTGSVVLANSPTLTTPDIGAATATTVNNIAITSAASPSTFTLAAARTFVVNRSLTLDGTDNTTITFPSTDATVARTDAGQTFTGTQTFSNAIVGGVQNLSGAGAISLTTPATKFTSTATGDALTLDDGVEGQIKIIVYVAETAGADTGILTPTNLGAGTTITFNDVGDACVLQFLGTEWWAISLRGAVLA